MFGFGKEIDQTMSTTGGVEEVVELIIGVIVGCQVSLNGVETDCSEF